MSRITGLGDATYFFVLIRILILLNAFFDLRCLFPNKSAYSPLLQKFGRTNHDW
jgi:hypothetical protein